MSRDTTVRLSRVLTLVWQLFGIGLGVSVYVMYVMCTHMHVLVSCPAFVMNTTKDAL